MIAAAAKSLQSCPTVWPHRQQPTRCPHPWDSPARTLEWVAISFSSAWKWKVKVKSLSRVWLLATPWTVDHQAPPSMGFSWQEYWSGMSLPTLPFIRKKKILHAMTVWPIRDCSSTTNEKPPHFGLPEFFQWILVITAPPHSSRFLLKASSPALLSGFPCEWVSEWVSEWKSLNHVQLFVMLWTIQSMEFSRPEYWSG